MTPEGAAPNAAPPVVVQVSDDRMRIQVSCTMPVDGPESLIPHVQEALSHLPFPEPLDPSQWSPRLLAAPMGGDILNLTILEGTAPVKPIHGRIEWAQDFFSDGFLMDPTTGRVDYRQRAAQRSVEAGQRVGLIVPPVEGVEGADAFGRPIPVEKARPARIRPGANVRLDEHEGALYATETGRIRLRDGTVFVDQVFTIEGNVGLETGDIRHPGSLVVRGDIEAHSTVETTGDVEVMGMVEAATVITDGSLIVHGGITGGEGKRIAVGGGVRARFIIDAVVEAGGAVVVETEIVQSRIRSRGAVSCPRGRLVGGRIEAQGGVEAMQTGTAAGVLTVIAAGEDFDLANELAECDARMVEWRLRRDTITDRLDQLKKREIKLEGPALEALHKIEAQVGAIDREMSAIQEQKRRLRETSAKQCRPQVFVYGRGHAETFLSVGGEKTRLTDTLEGPICIESAEGRVQMRVVSGHGRTGQLLAQSASAG